MGLMILKHWKIEHWSDLASGQGFLCYMYFFGLCFLNGYFEAQKSLFKEGLHIGTTLMNLFYVKPCEKIVKRI